MHLNFPPPPAIPASKILHNLCLSFVLSFTAVPRETENNAFVKTGGGGGGGGGQIRYIMGYVQVAYTGVPGLCIFLKVS